MYRGFDMIEQRMMSSYFFLFGKVKWVYKSNQKHLLYVILYLIFITADGDPNKTFLYVVKKKGLDNHFSPSCSKAPKHSYFSHHRYFANTNKKHIDLRYSLMARCPPDISLQVSLIPCNLVTSHCSVP